MKQSLLILLMAISGLCFKPVEDDLKDNGTVYATIDGRMFRLQPNQVLRGTLIKKSGAMNGKLEGKTMISASFNGPTYDKSDKTSFTENITIEMSYAEDKTGTPESFSAALQYGSNDYVMVKEQSKMKVTSFTWEADHKHFRINADFDCTMRSWGYPTDNKKDVILKGHMTNMKVTVPSWLATAK